MARLPRIVENDRAPPAPCFSRAAKVAALRRELVLRRRVYPVQVLTASMSQRDADYEIAILEAIIADYEGPSRQEEMKL